MLKHIEHTQQGLLKDELMPSSFNFIPYARAGFNPISPKSLEKDCFTSYIVFMFINIIVCNYS